MSSAKDEITGPLKGIRVLDWTMWQFGPVSTSMMGDMGADVIKIEGFDGDAGRMMKANHPLGRNPYFESCNRSKRGVVVNLKSEAGREVIYRLVKDADVFVQNFRQGVAGRLEMDYQTLKQHNPMLIYASANGYGPKGPESAGPSFDGCGQARAGLMLAATPFGASEPSTVQGGVSDQIGAIMVCLGVLSALVARHEQGIGQELDVSHLSSTMWLQGLHISMNGISGKHDEPFNRRKPLNPLSNYYRCKDDRWIRMMLLQADRYWPRFTQVLGMEEFLEDPRFDTLASRGENNTAMVDILDERFATKTYDEWDAAFKANGDFIYAKVQALDELGDDPQVQANGYIVDFDHPVLGTVKQCRHPINYYETPAGIWREAPEFGQHTEEVLLEAGYDWDDISNLRDAGAIL
ncbi:CoA transferase [Dehalococcoidia bacterium]|nr:CoA transferase [Dehalococcoidia bacterium]